ncbi:MAG: sensor histidine kinase, partial [Eubacterium sp.]
MDFMADATQRLGADAVDLTFYNEVDPAPYIRIDQLQFGRVIKNLLENSLKYGPRENLKISIRLKADHHNFIMEFQDNGPGVEEEALPKLFDSFYRTDPARSGSKKGSGLGLAITREIIETLGGSIWAE